MQDESEEFLSAALARLPREQQPPAGLEEATVTSLRRAGLLRGRMRTGLSLTTWLLAASIAGVAFVGGSMFASRNARATPAPAPTFALLLYGATSGEDSAAHAVRAAEYSAWANASRTEAQIVGGEAIGRPETALVWNAARGVDSVNADEPPGDSAKLVGYFLVEAASRDAAVKLAWGCPHLKYGGRVVVRRILPTDGPDAVVLVRQPEER